MEAQVCDVPSLMSAHRASSLNFPLSRVQSRKRRIGGAESGLGFQTPLSIFHSPFSNPAFFRALRGACRSTRVRYCQVVTCSNRSMPAAFELAVRFGGRPAPFAREQREPVWDGRARGKLVDRGIRARPPLATPSPEYGLTGRPRVARRQAGFEGGRLAPTPNGSATRRRQARRVAAGVDRPWRLRPSSSRSEAGPSTPWQEMVSACGRCELLVQHVLDPEAVWRR